MIYIILYIIYVYLCDIMRCNFTLWRYYDIINLLKCVIKNIILWSSILEFSPPTLKINYLNFTVNLVRYSSVSLSPTTLSRNEILEQHIRKKTHKLNALKFWVEGDVIPLCEFDSVLILVRSLEFCYLLLPKKINDKWFDIFILWLIRII